MIWHSATPEEVLNELQTESKNGLTNQEAKNRLKEYGYNLSVLDKEISVTNALFSQLKKPSVIILLSLLVIFILRELVIGTERLWIPLVIFLILALKETIFIYSEYKSINMLFRLKNRIKTSAKVIRDGKEITINSDVLVPGDIIKLTEGDLVPADARLIDSVMLRCDESVLYNENEVVAIQKEHLAIHEDHRPVKERSNMIYCGCHVISGTATAVVTETGENAEIRRMVKRTLVFSHKDVQDRISDRFSGFTKVFGISIMAACILLTILITFITDGAIGWGKYLEAVITAVCFYIAVVPENVSARIACMMALGIKRLEKDKAIIFYPSTLEKLAGVSVICTDKTGTLTQNKMVLRQVYDGERVIDLSYELPSKECEVCMRFGTLSCESLEGETADHTEVALVSAAARYLNIMKADFDSEFPRITSIPLTPERKIKTSVNMIDGKVFSIVRGAPDIILERCVDVNTEKIKKAYEELCNEGLRVLAISYKVLDDIPSEFASEELEYGLQFLGLFGISDRERVGLNNDIKLCREAGISTVMFTGDHINTASSMAEKMGILTSDYLAVTGEQLEMLSDEELAAVVNKIKVCVRFSPEQRVRFVNALHYQNETVLITADSVANHAPMSVADVGCAMGKTGTDVAKGNADVMVGDDSFGSIVKAIKNARGVFANLTKYAEYYVSICSAVFVSIILCIIFYGTEFLSSQILLLSSLFTLIFPIASLGYETADGSTMKLPPWNIGRKLFNVNRLINAAIIGIGLSIPSGIAYFINRDTTYAASAAFATLVISLILYMFSSRSVEYFYKRILHNRFMLLASLGCVIIIFLIVSTPISNLFCLNTMGLQGFITSLLLPFSILGVFEAIKLYKNIKTK